MVTVAVIAEYNPFHKGHEYHINKIRRDFGEDTRIVAIMSGNYTQRGEMAIADKTARARAAVECGVNLVLEIPFPYSISSAEFYARSGVYIAEKIGVVDYISFGSELGDIEKINEIASNMTTSVYNNSYKALESDKDFKSCGYAELCEIAYKNAFEEDVSDFLKPNNILALEYIKALKMLNSRIKTHTTKRLGASYSESHILDCEFQSASAIREAIRGGDTDALTHTPSAAEEVYSEAMREGLMPIDCESVSSALITSFLLNKPDIGENIHDAAGGLYNRLRNASYIATSISELVNLSETKKYTTSRIRRAIYYSFFGVTSSVVKELPAYAQILAFDSDGREILKRIKKESDFPLITKPSATDSLSDKAKRQKELSFKADALFALACPKTKSCNFSIKITPFVKKS